MGIATIIPPAPSDAGTALSVVSPRGHVPEVTTPFMTPVSLPCGSGNYIKRVLLPSTTLFAGGAAGLSPTGSAVDYMMTARVPTALSAVHRAARVHVCKTALALIVLLTQKEVRDLGKDH